MEQDVLVENTIGRIKKLPVARIQEVSDFIEFIIGKDDDAMITEGLQQLSSSGGAFDFLYDEPELYSVNDLKARFV
jgi:hypothetical protein